jgi:hypothetical protein
MALLNSSSLTFKDIRLILCVQGYTIEENFIPREIGFWNKNSSGVIPISCRIKYKNLDSKDKTTVKYLTTQLHGIDLKKQSEFSLMQNEVKSVIKTLYLSAAQDNEGKYIGICRDLNILSLCHSAGFQHLTVNLEYMNHSFISKKPPTNEDLKSILMNKYHPYSICNLHNKLENGQIPICAGVKAKFLADYLKKIQDKSDKI